MKIKICGVTQLNDALLCKQLGAWAVGFNFYKHSPRSIPVCRAKSLADGLGKNIVKIGVFVDAMDNSELDLLTHGILDYAQIHFQHAMPKSLSSKLIYVIQAKDELSLPDHRFLKQFDTLLLDAPPLHDMEFGGTDRLANWTLAAKLAKDYRLILAGGITPHNYLDAMQQVAPFALDIASGVEHAPGIKNHKLLQQLFAKETL